MNIRGIELLRSRNYPGPRNETHLSLAPRAGYISPSEVDLDWLYDGAQQDAAIIAFDHKEKIHQHQHKERDEHAYPVTQEDFYDTIDRLTEAMCDKGVHPDDVVFITHQAYLKGAITHSGRASITPIADDYSLFRLDATDRWRQANTDFDSNFRYHSPFIETRYVSSMANIVEVKDFPVELLARIKRDIIPFARQSPLLDFEVHKDWGLFYHDLSFDAVQPL